MENDYNELHLMGLKPVLELLHDNPDKIIKILLKKNLSFPEKKFLLSQSRKYGIAMTELEKEKMDRLSNGHSHQGIIALLSRSEPMSAEKFFEEASQAPLPLILVLDQIQDQGNLGTLARTAYALGCGGLLLSRHETASLSAGAWRASAGALEKIPVSIVPNLAKTLDMAEEKGFFIYGTISEADKPEKTRLENAFEINWNFPLVLILGNENKGIRPGLLKRCSQMVTIPFSRKFNSLNIAQAGAILIGLAARQFNIFYRKE